MKIEQENIDQIRSSFQKMQSKEDLLHLLNEAKTLVYGEKAVPFQLNQLTWYSNPKLAKNRYKQFNITKKSGAERTINAPVKGLKAIQKTISFILQCVYEPHQAATGFVQGKSIVDNAKVHARNKYVYNIDLKDFFPSIDQARVWKCLQLKPFNLIDAKESINLKVNENATITNERTSIFLNRMDEEHFAKLTFNGYRYSNGTWNIKLKDGGNILYKIEKKSVSDSWGKITVYKMNSSYDILYAEINNLTIDPNSNLNFYLELYFAKIIELHQKKLHEKNTRLRLANLLASLCCTEMEVERKDISTGKWVLEKRNVLPQGAPTSPVLSNVICQRLDYLLAAVAKRFGLNYTRYADDITFSSMHNVYQSDSEFIKELHRIIAEQGFHIKESKTRLQKEGYRQEVTGLLVNENVNVQKRYIKQLRMWLYYWETYGYEKAYSFFLQQYISDKVHTVKSKPDMANVIDGKLNYLKMVKGDENGMYKKLKDRFNKLTSKQSFISKVLDEWEKNGIEKAMELYYPKHSDITSDLNDADGIMPPFGFSNYIEL